MPTIPYTCTGQEAPGNAAFYGPNGNLVTVLWASRCFSDYYCQIMGYTWNWYDGIDPDDPTTWPGYEPPAEPTP